MTAQGYDLTGVADAAAESGDRKSTLKALPPTMMPARVPVAILPELVMPPLKVEIVTELFPLAKPPISILPLQRRSCPSC